MVSKFRESGLKNLKNETKNTKLHKPSHWFTTAQARQKAVFMQRLFVGKVLTPTQVDA
jgi:hypothetical protein